MANQYKIPQNLDIEDKILGPFTLKQFLYIIVGGITIYVLFNIIGIKNLTLFLAISIPIALLVLALVFIKINERPFVDFIFYFLQFLKEPRERRWIKSTKIRTFEAMVKVSEEEQQSQKELARLAKQGIVRSRLADMAMVLDTRGWTQSDVTRGELTGRIVSSVEEKALATKLVREDEKLDDIFSDLREAVGELQAGVEEEKYGELGERLKGLLG